jgi:hypothetical protein
MVKNYVFAVIAKEMLAVQIDFSLLLESSRFIYEKYKKGFNEIVICDEFEL